jgi:hypothetical protein
MKKLSVLSTIIGIVLIIGTGGEVVAQMTAIPSITGYFVGINGNALGPFDTAGLRQLIGNGQLTRDSLVWKEGMQNWAVVSTVKELDPLFSTPPPLLPTILAPQTTQITQPPVSQQQAASTSRPNEPWGGSSVTAGIINSTLGIWSWGNNDYFGGILTTTLQAGGIVCAYIGAAAGSTQMAGGNGGGVNTIVWTSYVGYAAILGGTVFGVVRGVTQYNKKMAAARSFAEAIDSNPLNNISLTAFPTFDNKGFVPALTYSLSF